MLLRWFRAGRLPVDRLRTAASGLARSLAAHLTALADGTATAADAERDMAAKHELMNAFATTPYRPTGLATADQGMNSLVQLLEWCSVLIADATEEDGLAAAAPPDRTLLNLSATVLAKAADMLAAQGWAAPGRIVSRGLSAGGLLQGAVFSLAPRRWRAVVAEVPFVDCVTTMLDPGIPLTVNEWDEWGDPRDPAARAYLASYSPYDNPPAGPRPDLLVTGSLHDPRVLIHEPAKWVARLRATDTAGSRVLFRPELGAGAHTGPAGRFGQLGYAAEILAFIVDAVGGRA